MHDCLNVGLRRFSGSAQEFNSQDRAACIHARVRHVIVGAPSARYVIETMRACQCILYNEVPVYFGWPNEKDESNETCQESLQGTALRSEPECWQHHDGDRPVAYRFCELLDDKASVYRGIDRQVLLLFGWRRNIRQFGKGNMFFKAEGGYNDDD